jgi:ParB family chromosome partitioning protein
MKSDVTELNIGEIAVKHQLRESEDGMTELENSIRKVGLLHPVIVDRDNILISGGRRLQACRTLGYETIRVIRVDTTFNSMTALDIIADENLHRLPLTNQELEKLIQLKKDILSGKTPGDDGVLSRLKKARGRA